MAVQTRTPGRGSAPPAPQPQDKTEAVFKASVTHLNLSVWVKRIKERPREGSLRTCHPLLPLHADTPRRQTSLCFGKAQQKFRHLCSELSTKHLIFKVIRDLGLGLTVL